MRGQGAFLNGEPMRVTDTSDPVQALVATGFPYTVAEDVDKLLKDMERLLDEHPSE